MRRRRVDDGGRCAACIARVRASAAEHGGSQRIARKSAGIDLHHLPHQREGCGRHPGRRCRRAMPWRNPATSPFRRSSGMMLDRGTKTLDKFAIAEKLDNVGAEITFAVGTQSLEIRAKCLKQGSAAGHRDCIAAELRTPRCRPPNSPRPSSSSSASWKHPRRTPRRAAQEAFRPGDISRGPSESSAFDCGISRRRAEPPLSMRSRHFTRNTMVRRT